MPRGVFSRVGSLLTPPIVVGATAIIAIVVVAYFYITLQQTPTGFYSTVTQGPIAEQVSASGDVIPTESVTLAFQRAGTISSIPVAVGSQVGAGQTLATLDSADLKASLQQAQANVAAAQAQLSSVESGTRPEQLSADRSAVAQAITAGYIAADDAVHNKVDQFFTNPRTTNPTLTIETSNSTLEQTVISERVSVETILASLSQQIPQGDVSSSTNLVALAQSVQGELLSVQNFLDNVNLLLGSAIATQNTSESTIQTYQTNVGLGRTEVSAALTTLNTDAGTLNVAEAGSTSQDIAAQQAAVEAAQAAVAAVQAELAQTVLSAPIGGTITEQSGEVGEVVSSGQSFISMQSNALFEIDVYISQIDEAKLKTGQSATVTLDAYPGVTFNANIVSINPSAVMQNGAPAYELKAQFTQNDPRIKAGLTANLLVTTAQVQNTLLIPSSAIVTEGTSTYAMVVGANGAQTLTPISVGIDNPGGQAQVLSGLTQGEQVASFGAAAQTTTETPQ
ncbi:MAG: efflux RND transporter periplasmic adaptor subunit [Patescibacteria group bacterium]|nr:efflux RND transporter periplasmic adaptor subunit [Patescibacteria group bacterium]